MRPKEPVLDGITLTIEGGACPASGRRRRPNTTLLSLAAIACHPLDMYTLITLTVDGGAVGSGVAPPSCAVLGCH